MSQSEMDHEQTQKNSSRMPQQNVPDKEADFKQKLISGVAAAAAFVVIFVFGIGGGLIGILGYMVVYGIIKSKLAVPLKVTIAVITVIVFIALLMIYVVFSAVPGEPA